MEEMDFHEARLDIAALEKDYEEVSLPTELYEKEAETMMQSSSY